MAQRSDLIVWIDLEMTGLEPESQYIIEIATVITDDQLAIVAEGPDIVIHQSDRIIEGMNPWSAEHHAASGLTANVRASAVSQQQAENDSLAFIAEFCAEHTAPLAGNSVHLDHRFLLAHMSTLAAYLNPDVLLDVSTVKELVRRWDPPALASAPKKAGSHRALEDILESIRELQHYREHVFEPAQQR